jgi:hypothetical protein
MAERDRALGLLDGTMPVDKAWLYERHAVPVPASAAELFKGERPEGRDQRPEEEPGKGASDVEHPTSNVDE